MNKTMSLLKKRATTPCDHCGDVVKIEDDWPVFYFGRSSDLTTLREDEERPPSWAEAKKGGWILVTICRTCYEARRGVLPVRPFG